MDAKVSTQKRFSVEHFVTDRTLEARAVGVFVMKDFHVQLERLFCGEEIGVAFSAGKDFGVFRQMRQLGVVLISASFVELLATSVARIAGGSASPFSLSGRRRLDDCFFSTELVSIVDRFIIKLGIELNILVDALVAVHLILRLELGMASVAVQLLIQS